MQTSFIVADSYEAAQKEAGDVIHTKVLGFQQRGIGRCKICTLMHEQLMLWLLDKSVALAVRQNHV